MKSYGTGYVPANDTLVTLVGCDLCGGIHANTDGATRQHEMTDEHKLAVAAEERRNR